MSVCACVCWRKEMLWADTTDSWISISPSRQIHTIRGTSHASKACEDGDNQPPPESHGLLLH